MPYGQAAGLARPGDTVLLAPAAASMDMFRDYAARGRRIRRAAARSAGRRATTGDVTPERDQRAGRALGASASPPDAASARTGDRSHGSRLRTRERVPLLARPLASLLPDAVRRRACCWSRPGHGAVRLERRRVRDVRLVVLLLLQAGDLGRHRPAADLHREPDAPCRMFRMLAYPAAASPRSSGCCWCWSRASASPPTARPAGWASGSFILQPSEIAKLALALWGADLLVRKRRLLGSGGTC